MGFIRGGLVVLVSSLLFLAIFSAGIFLTLSYSLEYKSVQPQLASISKSFITGNAVSQINLNELLAEKNKLFQEYCKNNSEYVFSYEGKTFVIPCELAKKTEGEIVDYGINYLINTTYYKERNCAFFDCLKKGDFMVLISEKAKNYWREKFYFALTASVILIVLLFFLLEKKSTLPIMTGSMLIISAILLMKLKEIILILINFLLSSEIRTQISGIILLFLGEAKNVAIGMIVIGGVVLCFGVVLNVLKIFKINIFEFKRILPKPQNNIKELKQKKQVKK